MKNSEYSKNYWIKFYERNKNNNLKESSFSKFVLNYIDKNKKILDICSGDLHDSLFFYYNDLNVFSFDIVDKKVDEFKYKKFDLNSLEDNFNYNEKFDYVYCRFVLHAIPEFLENYVLIQSNKVLNDNGLLFIETRSNKGVVNSNIDDHYRRLIDINDLKNKLINLNYEILYEYEEKNLSKKNNDNPILIRLIVKKIKNIIVDSNKSFREVAIMVDKKRLNKKNSKFLLLDVKKILNKYNVNFFLLYGTLLGAYRNKDFIEYDTDIDIGLFYEDFDKVKTIINKGCFFIYNIIRIRDLGFVISLYRDETYIDFYYFKNNEKEDYYECGKKFTIKKYQLNNLSKIKFLNETFFTVNNIEEFLTEKYDNWKVPIKNKHAQK